MPGTLPGSRGGPPAHAILCVAGQHDRMLALLNELHRELEAGRHTAVLRAILGRLSRLAEHHFASEQRILGVLTQSPPLATRWQAELTAYCDAIAELRAKHKAGEPIAVRPAFATIERWWLRHFVWHNEAWLRARQLDGAATDRDEISRATPEAHPTLIYNEKIEL